MSRFDGNPPSAPRSSRSPPAADPYSSSTWSGPPSRGDNVLARQLAALALIVLLYTASVPFTPVAWVLGLDGSPPLFDRLFGGVAVLSACYFQWRIAGLTRPLAVVLPGSGRPTVRDGRVERGSAALGFVWRPSDYWPCVVCEGALLALAEFGPSELLRRSVVCGVVAGLWAVGYGATPESTKRWAYEHLKAWVFWMVLDELMRVGGRSYGGRRRRY